MSQRQEYLARGHVARKAAAFCVNPDQRVLWAGIAEQWEALARQVGELEDWSEREQEPRSWAED